MGWQKLFAPMRRARDRLGRILPAIADATGLDQATPVLCGIHDSNASLLPHLVNRSPPFAVVSTGTWVVAMAIGGRRIELDPVRDTLVNVNAFGEPVPSARFMGGREFERLIGSGARQWNKADLEAVLSGSIMLLPAVQNGSGPFADRQAGWLGNEPSGGRRFLAVSFYLAMMTSACLELAGAEGEIIVEGAFAENQAYLDMLAAATRMPVGCQTGNDTGTSIGAAMLNGGHLSPIAQPTRIKSGSEEAGLIQYARAWKHAVCQ